MKSRRYMIVTTKNNTEQHEIMFKVKYNFLPNDLNQIPQI